MFVLDSGSCIFFPSRIQGSPDPESDPQHWWAGTYSKMEKKMSGALTQGDQPYDIDINYFSGAGVSLVSNL